MHERVNKLNRNVNWIPQILKFLIYICDVLRDLVLNTICIGQGFDFSNEVCWTESPSTESPSNSPPTTHFVALFLWLSVWLCHDCFILLNDMMDLHLLSLVILVPLALCYVFYPIRHQVYCSFDTNDMAFASTLIWYHTQTNTHSIYRDE